MEMINGGCRIYAILMNEGGLSMMKKLWKQNFWLLAALGAYALVSLYVYERSGIFIHRAIVWNVFLALLPYLFMTLFFAAQQRRHHLGMLAASISFRKPEVSMSVSFSPGWSCCIWLSVSSSAS